MAMVRPPATNHAQKLIFLTIYFRWGEGVPTSVLRSQPIIWLLSSSFLVSRFLRATRFHPSPVTGYKHLLVLIPNSVTHILSWWLDTINSKREDSINLPPPSGISRDNNTEYLVDKWKLFNQAVTIYSCSPNKHVL